MKRLVLEFNRLNSVVKTLFILMNIMFLTLSIYGVSGMFNKIGTIEMILKNINFYTILGSVNTYILLNLLKKINKKDTHDKFLRKDIFTKINSADNRIMNIEDRLNKVENRLINLEK